MTTTVLILDRQAGDYAAWLERAALPGLQVLQASDPDRLPAAARGATVAMGPPDALARALPRLPALAWAQSTWAGVEPLVAPGMREDYLLSGVKGVFGPQMAEYVLCYLLAHQRQVLSRQAAQSERRWDHRVPGRLAGKKIVLLGLGDIGREIARHCARFGMHTAGVTRQGLPDETVDRVFSVACLQQALADADFLVMSLPGTDRTRHLVDAAALAALPAHALVVNVGRGNCLDEQALDRALRSGKLGGAVLDVFETEPLPQDSPLWSAPNTYLTAHTAALSHVEDIAPLFIDNLRRFLAGDRPRYLVDFQAGY